MFYLDVKLLFLLSRLNCYQNYFCNVNVLISYFVLSQTGSRVKFASIEVHVVKNQAELRSVRKD